MLPTDSQVAKPKRAAASQREFGAISARRPVRWNGTACCADSERVPQFPLSQSSESHAQNTTPRVIRQTTDGVVPVSCVVGQLREVDAVESVPGSQPFYIHASRRYL